MCEIIGGEAPHVHRAEGLAVEDDMAFAIGGVVAIDDTVRFAGDVQVLDYVGEVHVLVVEADAAGYAAGLAEGVLQLETDDAIGALAVLVFTEPVAQDAEGILAVIVVAVDDGERLLDDILGHQHGVGGTPGFLALRVEDIALGNLVQFLGHEDELQRRAVDAFDILVFGPDGLLHLLTEILADDIDDLAESGLDGIINRIVDDGFSVGADAIHLFESSIAAAHSGGQDKQSRFHGISFSFC